MPIEKLQLPSLRPELLELARLSLSAIQNPERWKDYLQAFCKHFRADVSYIGLYSNQFECVSLAISHGYSDLEVEDWENRWAERDPWLTGRELSSLPLQQVISSQHLCSDNALETAAIYSEFMLPRGLHYGGWMNYFTSSDSSIMQFVLRSREVGPLNASEVDDWNQIASFVTTAITVGLERNLVSSETAAFAEHFSALGIGLLLISPQARIKRSNSAAREIMMCRRDILEKDGHVNFGNSVLEAQFTAVLKTIANSRPGNGSGEKSYRIAIQQDSQNSASALLLILTPIVRVSPRGLDANEMSILINLIEPRPATPPDTTSLQKLFGWTPAEARLAALLSIGMSLEKATATLGITVQTGRSHLKHLFAKTGFSRQGDLIAFVNQIAMRDTSVQQAK